MVGDPTDDGLAEPARDSYVNVEQGGVVRASGDQVSIRQGGSITVDAKQLELFQGAVIYARTNDARLAGSQSGILLARGSARLEQSTAGVVASTESINLDKSASGVIMANEVRSESGLNLLVFAKKFSGTARAVLGPKETALFAAVVGVIGGIVFALARDFLKHKRRRKRESQRKA